MAEEEKPLEVLVADDERFVTDLLKLSMPSEKVTIAVDGLDAMQRYDEKLSAGTPYDVVFTDLDMPKATGVDVIRHVKQKRPETLVYVVTGAEPGQEYEQLRTELKGLSPDGVIEKPFSPIKIAALIGDIKLYLKGGTTNTPSYQKPI